MQGGSITPKSGGSITRNRAPSVNAVLDHLNRLRAGRAPALPPSLGREVHQNRLLRLARKGTQAAALQLLEYVPPRRYSTLFTTRCRWLRACNKMSKSMICCGAPGVDMEALKRDLLTHGAEIDAILVRNGKEAHELGFHETSGLLINRQSAPSAIDGQDLLDLVATQRRRL